MWWPWKRKKKPAGVSRVDVPKPYNNPILDGEYKRHKETIEKISNGPCIEINTTGTGQAIQINQNGHGTGLYITHTGSTWPTPRTLTGPVNVEELTFSRRATHQNDPERKMHGIIATDEQGNEVFLDEEEYPAEIDELYARWSVEHREF